MAIPNPLLVKIILSIAKYLLKNFLEENLVSDVGSDLFDFYKGESEKYADRNSDLIDQLALSVIEEVKDFIESEYKELDKRSRDVVFVEVIRTLKNTEITANLLVDLRLNQAALFEYILASRKNYLIHFSEVEISLYKMSMGKISESIIKIAAGIPGFEPAFSSAVLENQENIKENQETIKENQEKILLTLIKQFSKPEETSLRYDHSYLLAVSDRLERLEIFGIPYVDSLARQQTISNAYTKMEFRKRSEQNKDFFKIKEQNELPVISSSSTLNDNQTSSNVYSIEQVLKMFSRSVIIGDPGSGKTTLLQWLSIRLANRDFRDELGILNLSIPFFIRLRLCVETGFPQLEDFPKQVALMVGGKPENWVHRKMESGRALVLIDGVDELPVDKRNEMLDSLKQLVNQYPNNRYIVTSRSHALKPDIWPEWDEWIEKENFAQFDIQPLSNVNVDVFIDQWFKSMAYSTANDYERAEIINDAIGLKNILSYRPVLSKLATNPLLCSMICALYRERHGSLPNERLKLYQECIEMLIRGRDESRKIKTYDDYPRLSYSQNLVLIQNFAYWLLLNGYSDTETEQADRHFEHKLPFMDLTNINGQRVRKFFVERTGLLKETVLGRVEFAHRTFQEYLASKAIINVNDIGLLIKNSSDDQWREVVILSVGEARPHEKEKILRGIINKARFRSFYENRQQALLALACLETCVELDPKVRDYVIQTAAKCFPPLSEDEAKIIASSGDQSVPFLTKNMKYEAVNDINCIRALTFIASPKALTAIAGYSFTKNEEIQKAIGRGWNVFNHELFASEVINKSKTLYLESFNSYEGFEHILNLEHLKIYSLKNFDDLSLIGRFTDLIELDVSGLNVSDFTFLENLINLRTLRCSKTSLSDLSPLCNHKKLKVLEISDTYVKDLSPLSGLLELTTLIIMNTAVSDLSPLYNLTELVELDVRNTLVSDVTPLVNMKKLTNLYKRGARISNMAPLANLTRLRVGG